MGSESYKNCSCFFSIGGLKIKLQYQYVSLFGFNKQILIPSNTYTVSIVLVSWYVLVSSSVFGSASPALQVHNDFLDWFSPGEAEQNSGLGRGKCPGGAPFLLCGRCFMIFIRWVHKSTHIAGYDKCT